MTDTPTIPFLIEEHELESKMQTIVKDSQRFRLIYHTKHLMPYNTATNQLGTQLIINEKYNCDYFIICSTHTLSEPPSAEEPGCHCMIM